MTVPIPRFRIRFASSVTKVYHGQDGEAVEDGNELGSVSVMAAFQSRFSHARASRSRSQQRIGELAVGFLLLWQNSASELRNAMCSNFEIWIKHLHSSSW